MKKFVCLFAGSANAVIINDFTGGYDVSNWDQSLDGGSIDLSGAPSSIIEISSDSGNFSFSPRNTDFTIAALGDGIVSFDWVYNTVDVGGSTFDPFGWLLNGVYTQVTTDEIFSTQTGSESFAVMTGDIFGFRTQSTDDVFGSSTTTISNFSAPHTSASVPAPASVAMHGLGLAGMGFSRKMKAVL